MLRLAALRLRLGGKRRQIRGVLGGNYAQRDLPVLELHVIHGESDAEGPEGLVRPAPKGRLREQLADYLSQDLVPVTGLRVERASLGLPRLLALRLELVPLLRVTDKLCGLERLERRL